MKKLFFIAVLAFITSLTATAQRFTDDLGRGLVAIPTGASGSSTSNLVSWRRLAHEYYDVTYNLYKDGTRVAENLTITNYNDEKGATATTQYQVAAVVNGVEQAKCDAVTPWTQYIYRLGDNRTPTGYIDIALAAVYDRNGTEVTINYSPNDAEMADLDGDGELEIIIKRLNTVDAAISEEYGEMYSTKSTQFAVLDAYDVDWQTGSATLMWRIDCGPNMVSMNSSETNIIAYDWDCDGKAEVVLRGADDMIVYNGSLTKLYTIGTAGVNTRNNISKHNDSQYAWTRSGNEYLVYMNGETAALYQQTEWPLKRLENGETSLNTAWGDDYGHRSTKHFMGAPVLDGRNASLFLARGIYTRHKMIALDLVKGSHTWTTRWTWNCNNKSSAWYANGNHNYVVADVDEDGRDEIVYGSMVIDDNGKGLSTTGLGHGDALHVSDFDPYRKGLEVFAANEDHPNNNYRNATTSEVYYRHTGSDDDGRAIMANFSSTIPGCIGTSVNDGGLISSVKDASVGTAPTSNTAALYWSHLNFRIYWDGDLCSEILDSPGTEKEAAIYDHEKGRLFTSSGCNMNNDSKNNPCFQGDIIGDWREEIVVRCGTNLRVYTTGIGTSYSLPCLWYDHQYRQAMVWQMMAYNQPPHLSYFVGELEDMTIAPPAITNRERTEIANGATIGSSTNGEHLLLAETNDMTVSVTNGAAPSALTINTPSWVQGHDNNNNITTTLYTHTLKGGAFTGSMRLVKQGDGTLVLPNVTETYTGETSIWGGTLQFNGTLQNSALWMNRFTKLISSKGTFNGGITANYAAAIIPGGENNFSSITTTTLTLNYGARLVLDVDAAKNSDKVNATTLVINAKSGEAWENYGPEYLKPVVQIVAKNTLSDGKWDLGAITSVSGDVSNLALEGVSNAALYHFKGHLWLVVGDEEIEKTLYERGFETAWSNSDLTDWTVSATSDYLTYTINDGLYLENTSANDKFKSAYSSTKTIAPTKNSIVTMTATAVMGKPSGRKTSYDYLTIGDVSLRVYGDNKQAQVYIDNVAQGEAVTATRGGTYTLDVEIDQATGAVNYSVSGSSTIAQATATTSTAITNVMIGHARGGSENYGTSLKLTKIKITEVQQDVTEADYTIHYIYNGETIKTVEGTSVIEAEISAENPIVIDDVKYFAKDGATTTMKLVADAASNVLNVELRQAETFNFTLRALDGESHVLNDNLAAGSITEGETATVAFPRYVLSATTLYEQNTGTVSYSTTFTPDADGYVKDIIYGNGTIDDVVFYTEGEAVSGVSKGNNGARASMGQMGHTGSSTAYLEVTTLEPAKYVIYMRTQNGNSTARAYSFLAGDEEVFSGSFPNGTNIDAYSEEFNLNERVTLSFASEGSSASGIDYFYLVRTGDPDKPTGISYHQQETTQHRFFNLKGQQVEKPVKGLYILRQNRGQEKGGSTQKILVK